MTAEGWGVLVVGVARALIAFFVLLGSLLAVVPAADARGGETTPFEVHAVATSDEDPYADTCAARALIPSDPERAVQLVVDIRTWKGNPAVAPTTSARAKACENVLGEVVASQALTEPQLDDATYCDVLGALRRAEAEDQAARLADRRETICDAATMAWIEEVQADPPLDTSEIGDAWAEFMQNTLTPLAALGSFLLAASAALIVLARLLVFFPFRDCKSFRWSRGWLSTMGLLAIFAGPIWFAVSATRDPPGAAGIVGGIIVGLTGAALTGWWIGTLPRVTVEVSGEKKYGVDSGLIAAVLRDMAGRAAGRGLELPVGPDLADVGTSVSEVSKNEWVALAERILLLITNVKPWRVQVEVLSEKATSVVIGRNGRQVEARRVEAKFGRHSDDDDEAGCTDAQRIAAFICGLVIATMRTRYERDFAPGLHGATKWNAIALQYITSRWYNDEKHKTAALGLLMQARLSDPKARLAHVTYMFYKYRNSTSADELRTYLVWLDGEVRGLRATGDKTDQLSGDLAARLTVTYAAIWRNWTAARAAEETAAENRKDWLEHPGEHLPKDISSSQPTPIELIEKRANPTRPTGRPTRRPRRADIDARLRQDRLKIDWYLLDPKKDVSQLKFAARGADSGTDTDVLELGDSPDIAYDLACALARSDPDDGKVQQLLRRAFEDPLNAEFARETDPELILLRNLRRDWFTKLTKQPEPELEVPPFKGYASKLGVMTREELAAYSWKPTSPLDVPLVGRLRSSALLSWTAERVDEQSLPQDRLGREARTVMVRHLHERRTAPGSLDDEQLMALLTRIREVGYRGSAPRLKEWLAKVDHALSASG